QTRLAGRKQELETLVGRLGGPEPGVRAHRPEAAPVHVALDSPCVGKRARLAELDSRVEAGQVLGPIKAANLYCRVRPAINIVTRHRQSVSPAPRRLRTS